MATRRSLKLVFAVLVAGLGAGTTFAWAGVLIGGHRADNIGTFEPASSNAFAPVDPNPISVSTTISGPPRTSVGTITRPPSDDDNEPPVDDD